MKKLKLLFLFTVLSAITFSSCTDNESIENQAVTENSSAFRLVLNQFKNPGNISGRNASDVESFCFEFVFPLTLSYNTGTVVTVDTFEGLESLLLNETEQVYLTGVSYPFQVVMLDDNSTATINTEDDLWAIIEACNITSYDDYVFSASCYEFVYPFSFVDADGGTITVDDEQELFGLFTDPNQGNLIVDFLYPFSVIYENQTVVINNQFEIFEITENCYPSAGCICPTVYEPVCVQTANGVVEFSNQCLAECEGYTTADFVNCDASTNNGFEQLGTCFTIEYPVQVQFQGAVYNVSSDDALLTFLNAPGGATVVYPIVINGATTPIMFTIESQQGLENVVSQLCN